MLVVNKKEPRQGNDVDDWGSSRLKKRQIVIITGCSAAFLSISASLLSCHNGGPSPRPKPLDGN